MKEFFDWAGHSPLGLWMRDSRYAFPGFETLHLIALAVLLGSIFFVNARFFGLGLRRQRVSDVAADFAPWIVTSLVVMAVSGVPLFCSKAPDLWEMDRIGFVWKMSLIAFGVVWHFGVVGRLARKDDLGRGRFAAGLSLLVWFGAAVAGLSLEFL
jgi:hypothetical protein